MTELQTTWGWLVAVYLFLGGLGAGASIVAHLLALFTRDRFQSTVRFGAWFAAIALGLGSAVLLADVGKPFRAIVLFRSFVNPSSWMMRGAWLLFVAMIVNGLSALLWTKWSLGWMEKKLPFVTRRLNVWRQVIAGIAVPLNLAVAAYTGVLIGVLPFRPFWNTALLPVLFTISALDTGIGVVCAYVSLREPASKSHGLHAVFESCVIALILSEAAVVYFYLRQMLQGSADAAQSAALWLNGTLAIPFWLGVVSIGLAVPLIIAIALLISSRLKDKPWVRYAPVVGMAACLTGGWILRFIVLSAGLQASIASPYVYQALEGVRFIP